MRDLWLAGMPLERAAAATGLSVTEAEWRLTGFGYRLGPEPTFDVELLRRLYVEERRRKAANRPMGGRCGLRTMPPAAEGSQSTHGRPLRAANDAELDELVLRAIPATADLLQDSNKKKEVQGTIRRCGHANKQET